jgi:exopolysaccharide biosynthesis polyprenyl glycosylphosphotransferase
MHVRPAENDFSNALGEIQKSGPIGVSIYPKEFSQKRKTPKRRRRRWLFAAFISVLDMSVWVAIYYGASFATGSYNLINAQSLAVPCAVMMISIGLVGAYRNRTDFASLRYASEHLIACVFGYFISAFFLYVVATFGPNPTSSRAIFSASIIAFGLVTLLSRRFFWFARHHSDSAGKFVAIVDGSVGPRFYQEYLKSGQHQKIRYVAASGSMLGKTVAGAGTPELRVEASHILPHFDRETGVSYEAIILAADIASLEPKVIQRLGVIHFEEMPVYSLETFYENYWSKIPLELIGPAWPLEADFVLVQHSVYSSIKRFLDFLVACAVFLLLLPIMIIVAFAIKLIDGFPFIYSQERVGLHMVPFRLYKFRTMPPGSDKGDSYTREKDVRVTRLGSFLRKTRLDELPQLWNVLCGDMSMIGPRAEWTRLVDEYERQIPYYHFRHLVRPGISGWAQVNYPYGASLGDTLEKLSYDLYYIRNFSLRLDAEVLLKTLHVVFFGKGQ